MNKICHYCNTKNKFLKNRVKVQDDGYGIYCRFCGTFIKIIKERQSVVNKQEILNVLLDRETNLNLKTHVMDTLKLQVSNNRHSRTEFIDMITSESIVKQLIDPINKTTPISMVLSILIVIFTIPLIVVILTKIFK